MRSNVSAQGECQKSLLSVFQGKNHVFHVTLHFWLFWIAMTELAAAGRSARSWSGGLQKKEQKLFV